MGTCLLKGKEVLDGKRNEATTPGAVLIRDGMIEAVGQPAIDMAETDVEVIDCRQQTLLPGLIDCHNHLSLDPTLDDYLHLISDPVPELTIRATRSMQVDLMSGVTTSRYLGDKEFLDIHCRKAQADGRLMGPRIITATRGLRAPHGHGFVGYPFSGVEDVRKAVRENLAAGANFIKVYLTGTLRGAKGLPQTYSRQEVQALVDEAHRAGVPVATHCVGGPALRTAVETGIDVIEHGYFIEDWEIELLMKQNRWIVLTPSIFFTDARIQTLPASLIEGHLQQRQEVAQRMKAVIASGVKYAAGTDGMHGELWRELKYLCDFGASPAEGIKAATYSAALVCGLAQDHGLIAAGYRADVIGVEGDPLKSIEALQKVRTVIQGGRLVKSE